MRHIQNSVAADVSPRKLQQMARTDVRGYRVLRMPRRFAWLTILMAAALAVPALAETNSTPAPAPAAEPPGVRLLRFPPDRSLGHLYVRRQGTNLTEWNWGLGRVDADSLGEARGDVTVPGGKQVALHVETAKARDLSPLKALRPEDLQMLWLDCAPGTEDHAIACAAELTGLKQLALNGTLRGQSLRPLARMRGLMGLRIVSDQVGDVDLNPLMALNKLECLLLEVHNVDNPRLGIPDAALACVGAVPSLRELSF